MKRLDLALISDTHCRPFFIGKKVDALIHSGDITNCGGLQNHSVISLNECKYNTFWIKGNHDLNLTKIENTTNITDKEINIKGYTCKGVSLSPCYNAPHLADYYCCMTADKDKEFDYYNKQLNKRYDIIVSHSPPSSALSTEIGCGNIGSEALLKYIKEFQPLLVCCGHVHKPLKRILKIGKTTVINVALILRYVTIENSKVIINEY